MIITGTVLLVLAIVGLWLSGPSNDGNMKSYLRGGADVLVAIAITGGLGTGAILTVVGIAKYY